MSRSALPVPGGFVVLTKAYVEFIDNSGLGPTIHELLSSADPGNTKNLEDISQKINKLIMTADVGQTIEDELFDSFHKLGSKFVAVRSSAPFEDGFDAAWAGQLETYLNITEPDLIDSIKKCWASLFTQRAIFYRSKNKVSTNSPVAVVVQAMIDSEISGVAFSVHPVTEDPEQLVVDAGYGLGELIVSGEITPDSYIVQKNPINIVSKNIKSQKTGLFRAKDGLNEHRKIAKDQAGSQKLSDEKILELSKLIINIENHYEFACDIEWALADGKFYILQCRPITTIHKVKDHLDQIFMRQVDQDSIMRFEGDFMPFQLMIDWWNYYDIKQDWQGIYPVLFFFTPHRTTAYISQDKYRGIAIEALADFVNGKQSIATYKRGYEKFAKKISRTYSKYFSKGAPNETETQMFDSYVSIHKDFQELVAWTLFYEQLDESAVSEVLAGKNLSLELIWKAVKLPLFVSFDTRKKQLMIEASKGKITPNYLRFAFTEYTFFASEEFVKNELNKSNQETLGAQVEQAVKVSKKARADLETLLEEADQQTKDIIAILQWVLFCRDERKDIINQAELLLYSLSENLLKAWGINPKLINQIGISEMLQGKKYLKSIEKDLPKRTTGFGVLYQKNRKMIIGLKDLKKQIKTLDQIILNQITSQDSDQKIKGETGNRGLVEGKVRIVRKRSEFNAFKDGEILITGMTRPEFVPLMEKASGIITDEGGITSHAAIVSRELDKPCLIGTKIATQVLQTGDEVILDSTRGYFIKK